jgi:hypothetical protein
MTRLMTLFTVLLAAAALIAGFLLGRVIEAIAVAAVLLAISFYFRRLGAPDDEPRRSGSNELT